MKKQREEAAQQIQLELPDYSREYYEYMAKKQKEVKKEETVIIIDI